jgi:hypothetical protein
MVFKLVLPMDWPGFLQQKMHGNEYLVAAKYCHVGNLILERKKDITMILYMSLVDY